MTQFHPDPYNQYTQIDRIPLLLKRFPFSDKMKLCCDYSVRSFEFLSKKDKSNFSSNLPLPWVVETLAMMCIEAKENPNCSHDKALNRHFADMYNAVLNYMPKDMINAGDNFINYFGSVHAQTQFMLQETDKIKFFRYYNIFTYQNEKVNIGDYFKEKFKAPYLDYLQLCEFFIVYLTIKKPFPRKLLHNLINKRYKNVVDQLSISRDNYIADLHKMTNYSEDKSRYVFCVRPSYKYAFILEKGEIYVPQPHLFPICVTSSLFYRLTEGDNKLRDIIGKNVLEDYLLMIVKNSGIYDSVRNEMKYEMHGSEALSPDVMAVIGNELLFLDSKASVPPKDIRFFDQTAYEKTIDRYAGFIVQLYHQVLATPEHLNPFPAVTPINKNQIWAAAVVHEDARFLESELYHRVNIKLHFEENSPEAVWIKKHLRIISLYDVELYCFSALNLIEGIKTRFSEDHEYSFKNQALLDFQDQLYKSMNSIVEEVMP